MSKRKKVFLILSIIFGVITLISLFLSVSSLIVGSVFQGMYLNNSSSDYKDISSNAYIVMAPAEFLTFINSFPFVVFITLFITSKKSHKEE